MEWIVAAALFALFLLALPRLLAKSKQGVRKGGGGGLVVALGMIFASAFDPARAAATEQLDRRREAEDAEGETSGAPE